jgi:hypothetical protein
MPVYFVKRCMKLHSADSAGDASFAADVLGARGTLLSVLGCFFEREHWGSPVEMGKGQSLTAEDQLFEGWHSKAERQACEVKQ